jgi:hypothetical protein
MKETKACALCGAHFHPKNKDHTLCSVECKNKSITIDKTTTCAVCGKVFERPHGKPRLYCSRSCSNKGRTLGKRATYDELGPRIQKGFSTAQGYIKIKVDAEENGVAVRKYKQEHRIIVETLLGRELDTNEFVHHKNGIRNDNRPDNLELWTTSFKDPHGVRAFDIALDRAMKLSVEDRRRLCTMIS